MSIVAKALWTIENNYANAGLTLDEVAAVCGVSLVDALRLDTPVAPRHAAPRLIEHAAFTIAGLSARYNHDTAAGIPALWQRYVAHAKMATRATPYEYGVCIDTGSTTDPGFDYICGLEVAGRAPSGLSLFAIPAQRYAVFFHAGHISAIRSTWRAIFYTWLPASSLRATGGPEFERYDARFDGATGDGGVEIWIPVAP